MIALLGGVPECAYTPCNLAAGTIHCCICGLRLACNLLCNVVVSVYWVRLSLPSQLKCSVYMATIGL